MGYHGVALHDFNSQQGLAMRRKNVLPYHIRRRHQNVQVMGNNNGCPHSLVRHEQMGNQTVSYALPCQVKLHKNPKKAVHKDSLGRTWR